MYQAVWVRAVGGHHCNAPVKGQAKGRFQGARRSYLARVTADHCSLNTHDTVWHAASRTPGMCIATFWNVPNVNICLQALDEVRAQLHTKASVTEVGQALAIKADVSEVEGKLRDKFRCIPP